MKIYTYSEVQENIKKEFSRLTLEKLENGELIESIYKNQLCFSGGSSVSISDYGYNIEQIGVNELRYVRVSSVWGNYRYVTSEDFNNIIIPMREQREQAKRRSTVRLVESIPNSLIEKLQEIPGFKKVTVDNLIIIKNNDTKTWLLNCGTNKVMEYYSSKWEKARLKESYTKKDQFNYLLTLI